MAFWPTQEILKASKTPAFDDPRSQEIVDSPIEVDPTKLIRLPEPTTVDPKGYLSPEELTPIEINPSGLVKTETPHEASALESTLSGATMGAVTGAPGGPVGVVGGAVVGGLTGLAGHQWMKANPPIELPSDWFESAGRAIHGVTQFPAAIAEDVTGLVSRKRTLGQTINRMTNEELMDPARKAAADILSGSPAATKDPFGTALAVTAPLAIGAGMETKLRGIEPGQVKPTTALGMNRRLAQQTAEIPAPISLDSIVDLWRPKPIEINDVGMERFGDQYKARMRQDELERQWRQSPEGAMEPIEVPPPPSPVGTGGPEFQVTATRSGVELPQMSEQENVGRVLPPLLTDHPVQMALREVYGDQGTAMMEGERIGAPLGIEFHAVQGPEGWKLRLGPEPSVLGPEYEQFRAEAAGPVEPSSAEAMATARAQAEINRIEQEERLATAQQPNLVENFKEAEQQRQEAGTSADSLINKGETQGDRDAALIRMLGGTPKGELAEKGLSLPAEESKSIDVTDLFTKSGLRGVAPETTAQATGPGVLAGPFKSKTAAIVTAKRLGSKAEVVPAKEGGFSVVKFHSGIDLTEGAKILKEGLIKIAGTNFGELLDKVGSRWMRPVGEIADPTSDMYKNSLARISKYEADNTGNVYTFDQFRNALQESHPVLSEDSMRRVRDAREGHEVQLNQQEAALLKAWSDVADPLAAQARGVGVLKNALDNFYTHIILEAPKSGELKEIKTGLNKGWFTKPRSEEAYTGRDLEAKGYKLLNDPREVIPLYKYYMTKEIYKAELVRDLFTLKTEEGWPAIIDGKNIPEALADRYVKPSAEVDSLIRDYRRKIGENQGPRAIVNMQIGEGSFKMHTDTYKNVEAVVRSLYTNDYALKINSILSDIRRINLLNPLVHGYNTLSAFLQIAGKDIVRTSWLMDEGKKAELTDRYIAGGGKPTNIFDIQRMLSQGEYVPKDRFSLDKLWTAVKTDPGLVKTPLNILSGIREFSDYVLWDRIVAPLQIKSFETMANRLAKEHPEIPLDKIDKAAATVVNDFYGTMAKNTATWGQQKVANVGLLAPRWTPSMLRELVGGLELMEKGDLKVLPKMFRIEGIAPELRKSVGAEYAKGVAYGIAGMIIFGNILQAGMATLSGQPFAPTWENEEGHKLDVRLYKTTPGEGEHYLKSPLFRQMEDMAKFVSGDFIKIGLNKEHPLWRELMQQMGNVDFFKKEAIYTDDSNKGEMANILNAVTKRSQHAAIGLTPLGTFAGRPEQYRDWTERITPFLGMWVTHGMPAGGDPGLGNLLKHYVDFKESSKQTAREAKIDITNTLKGGDKDAAATLVAEYTKTGKLTPNQIISAYKQLEMPFMYRIMTSGNKLDPEFMKFLVAQTPEKQVEYQKLFNRLQTKARSQ